MAMLFRRKSVLGSEQSTRNPATDAALLACLRSAASTFRGPPVSHGPARQLAFLDEDARRVDRAAGLAPIAAGRQDLQRRLNHQVRRRSQVERARQRILLF